MWNMILDTDARWLTGPMVEIPALGGAMRFWFPTTLYEPEIVEYKGRARPIHKTRDFELEIDSVDYFDYRRR